MRVVYSSICLLVFLPALIVAQALLDEYKDITGHDEAARLDVISANLQDNPALKLSFIVHVGEGNKRIGSIRPYIKTVKFYLSEFRAIDLKRVDFHIVNGKTMFLRRIWVYRETEKPSDLNEFKEFDFDFKSARETILFAKTCLNCDGYPTDPKTHLIDWDLLSEILNKNSQYTLRVEIQGNEAFGEEGKIISAKKWFNWVKRDLRKESGIAEKRVLFKKLKNKDKSFGTMASFYIVPNINK